jgi:hypothetical protein
MGQLKLLGVQVDSSEIREGAIHWAVRRGGYYVHIIEYLGTHPKYRWNAGLQGNVTSFLKEGWGCSSEDCAHRAHQSIAEYIREVDEVRSFVMEVTTPASTISRYQRDPVI